MRKASDLCRIIIYRKTRLVIAIILHADPDYLTVMSPAVTSTISNFQNAKDLFFSLLLIMS
ncbi:MAG: hypothetical protein DI535_17635 [Citrobacter freundii]|nr:MAG: hypothetical protein DI535_17635 [Citrobacter freundii]